MGSVTLLFIRLCVITASFALFGSASAAPLPLSEGWEYRWGDSPFTESGRPEWALADAADGDWHTIGFPSGPPNRQGREHVWFRITLPGGEWREPVLYIFSVDLIFQVYFEGEPIYQYGTFDDAGRGRFEGWPWHEVALPQGFEGKPLYFRVFSNYTDIGLWGEVSIMDRPDLVLYILKNSLEALVIAGFSALIGLLALIFASLQTEKKSFGSIALFAFSSATMLLAESQASQLLWHAPLIWDYVSAGSYYLLPVAMALLLEQWLTDQRPWVINLIWKFHLLYATAALGLAAIGAIDLSSTFPLFDGLFLITLVTIILVVIRSFRNLIMEQRVILLTYGFFCALLVVDMGVAHGILPWGRVPVSWGTLLFSLSVVLISLWHYAHNQQALHVLNLSLEQQVTERTRKAESLVRREQARVRLLTFENEKSRILNDIIAGLQDCLSLSQALNYLARVMPDLCSPLRGALYQRVDDGRAYDRLAYWGYAGEVPGFSPTLDTSGDIPQPTPLPSRYRALPDSDPADEEAGVEGTVCFHIDVQSASEGMLTLGLLMVEIPENFALQGSDYGAARLFHALDQGLQRIGITLSSISLQEDLQKYSYEDALTGLKNRRYFNQLLEHENAVAERSKVPLALLIVDIDHFKRFNDNHGHEAGDSALQSVARVLSQQFRDSDVVCRFGGEEFVVIMPGASLSGAREKAEDLCRRMRATPLHHGNQDLGFITLSVGVAAWPECTDDTETLLGLADRALYKAKEGGRDRIEGCPADLPAGLG
ncbi:diguanylate cyclase [Marinobacter sp.]|uniref:diguanylate cyclase n=1 Tax=Marinobacter sp. TaxID=50741 RepID=UPI0034A48BE2